MLQCFPCIHFTVAHCSRWFIDQLLWERWEEKAPSYLCSALWRLFKWINTPENKTQQETRAPCLLTLENNSILFFWAVTRVIIARIHRGLITLETEVVVSGCWRIRFTSTHTKHKQGSPDYVTTWFLLQAGWREQHRPPIPDNCDCEYRISALQQMQPAGKKYKMHLKDPWGYKTEVFVHTAKVSSLLEGGLTARDGHSVTCWQLSTNIN